MWINNYTGEVYDNLWHMIATIIEDMIHYPACRTIEMLNISRYKPSK